MTGTVEVESSIRRDMRSSSCWMSVRIELVQEELLVQTIQTLCKPDVDGKIHEVAS